MTTKPVAFGARGELPGAGYVAALWTVTPASVPESLMRRISALVADTVAVAGLAASRPEVAALATFAPAGPSSSVLEGLPSTTPEVAAAINGTAAVWNELDEGFRGAGHPGAHVVPAAIAVAEAEGRPLAEALVAILCGYQVQADLGAVYTLRDEVHPHGALGAPAAAAAAAKVLGLDARTANQAIAIAANLAPAGSWSSCTEGSTVRNVLAGQGAQLGVKAAYLARAGVTAPPDSLDVAFGLVRGRVSSGEHGVWPSVRGEWAIAGGYLKRWSACAWSHTSLDVVDELLADHTRTTGRRIDPDDIDRVDVRVPAVTMRLAGVHVEPPLAVRFSVPAMIATLIVHGSLLPFADDLADDAQVRALAERIHLVEDESLSASWPVKMPAAVRVSLHNGGVLAGRLEDPIGPHDDAAFVASVRHKLKTNGLSTALLDSLVDASLTSAAAVQGVFAPGHRKTDDFVQSRS